mgnify:CR=1 FL=1
MRWYLLSAAAIPLLAVALLVLRNDMREIYVVSGVCTTGIGLLASFYAYQKLDDTMVELAKVLGDQRRRLTV